MLEEYMNTYDKILCDMADKMFIQKIENNILKNFISTMIYHHEASNLICENIKKYTQNIDIKSIADDIIKTQNEEILNIKKLDANKFLDSIIDIDEYMINYREIITTMIFKMYHSPKYENIDLDFIEEIIPHYEGFIFMCENLLKYNIDSNDVCFIKNIINIYEEKLNKLNTIKETLK